MKFQLWKAVSALALIASLPAAVWAQEAATVTGRVTSETGAGVVAATVGIPTAGVTAQTGPDGTYTLTVPASRIRSGQQVQITAQRWIPDTKPRHHPDAGGTHRAQLPAGYTGGPASGDCCYRGGDHHHAGAFGHLDRLGER
jgi:hypothetical protein